MKNRIAIASFAAIAGIALSFGSTSNAADLSPFAEGDKAKRARLADLEANADSPPENE